RRRPGVRRWARTLSERWGTAGGTSAQERIARRALWRGALAASSRPPEQLADDERAREAQSEEQRRDRHALRRGETEHEPCDSPADAEADDGVGGGFEGAEAHIRASCFGAAGGSTKRSGCL